MRILLFLLWITLGLVYFLVWNQRSSCCQNTGLTSPERTITSPATTPITPVTKPNSNFQDPQPTTDLDTNQILTEAGGCALFMWGKSDPIQKPCFSAWVDSVISNVQEGQHLEIIGEYNEKENQVMASGDLGLIRAAKIKELIQSKFDASRIRTRSIAVEDTLHAVHKVFAAIRYRPVFMNEQIKELDTKTLIYFKFASKEQLNNQLVVNYAAYLANKFRTTTDEILLVGHTDDDATAEHNMNLGLQRAQLIKNLLMTKGIKGSRIKISSKGETEPISPNDTEENRKLNRRVELTIIPSSQPN